MTTDHLEILVEERSMEAFLRELLPGVLGGKATFNIYPSRGKDDLLRKLPDRLRAYSVWLPKTWRVMVIVDRDDDDCRDLKRQLEAASSNAGLRTRKGGTKKDWRVVNRIAVEELEAWYFGDWESVREAFPGVPAGLAEKANYRDPDSIAGGAWEALERILKRAGYFESGLPKMEVARLLGKRMVPARNRSHSFCAMRDALLDAVK